MSDNIIELKNIFKSYDGKINVVEDINLEIERGEFVTLLGPSGCGKTTTLRMIAGFELPTSGQILLDGKDISVLPPNKRPINTVFQKYALFPHLNIFENIAFGLRMKVIEEKDPATGKVTTRKLKDKEIVEKVHHALEIVDLEGFDKRSVSTLSGGQQQRVAIARAIVNEPKILLLDEPLGALDLKMRKEMQIELKAMHKELGITFIYVTHDQEEALTMSDKIVVMSDGCIQQIGTPEDIYNEPVNAFVADFIGESNIFNGRMVDKLKVEFCGVAFDCVDDYPKNQLVEVVVRPEDIKMIPADTAKLTGTVTSVTFKGVHHEITVESGKYELVIRSTRSAKVGDVIGMKIGPEEIHVMERESSDNILEGGMMNSGLFAYEGTMIPVKMEEQYPGSVTLDEEMVKLPDGREVTASDLDMRMIIPIDAISMSDDPKAGIFAGNIISLIYKGDHYKYVVRTKNETDFVVDDEFLWNENDYVSLVVDMKRVRLEVMDKEEKK
ncbi:MAG: ABC transporter ATP-binding protein [Lachnospiraceae bacterium]|nr:ABC transporter ATP-binding protein [Lachnospiraceae bacterium]